MPGAINTKFTKFPKQARKGLVDHAAFKKRSWQEIFHALPRLLRVLRELRVSTLLVPFLTAGKSNAFKKDLGKRSLPIAGGSDTGGSLRNPPAFCNVVGLRPSPGRVPGDSTSWSPLSVSGPIARTVADVALFTSR